MGELLADPQPRSVEDLAADLRRLGVASGDVVMVQASLRAIGPVEGRADGVLDALEAVLGPDGTMVMNLGARDDWDWVNKHPEAERPELLRDAEPFDHLTVPADPEVGVLAEVFRERPGVQVGNHPDGRFGATGALAEHLVRDVPWNDYYGPGSPLERFVEAGGRVLRLGADPDTVSVLHYAEYLTPVPSKRRVRRHHVVAGTDDPEVRVVECLDDDDGIAGYDGDDYFAVILREYLATGRALTGLVGGATSELIEAGDMVPFGAAWMARNLADQATAG